MTTNASRRAVPAALLLLAVLAVTGCARREEVTVTTDTTGTAATPAPAADSATRAEEAMRTTMPVEPATPPDHIEVQHVLIGFEGKIPGKNVTRSQAEAEQLANEILDRARKGEDFDQLVQRYTDDQWPGIYTMANRGVALNQGEIARDGMVKGFSDASFALSPGNVGLSPYHPENSPYGWHIIKRLK